jgi:hypothetical protein
MVPVILPDLAGTTLAARSVRITNSMDAMCGILIGGNWRFGVGADGSRNGTTDVLAGGGS